MVSRKRTAREVVEEYRAGRLTPEERYYEIVGEPGPEGDNHADSNEHNEETAN